MSRLYGRIYLALLGVVVAFFALSAALFFAIGPPRDAQWAERAGQLAQLALPPPEAPREAQQHALDGIARSLHADAALFAPDGALIASAGRPLRRPDPSRPPPGFGRHRPANVALPDGRWLVIDVSRPRGPRPLMHGLAVLALFAALLAIAAYPLARSMAGRVEKLAARVDAFGAGDLAARAPVDGADEVARLAGSFNAAADRIQRLVNAQRTLLASASHELRSPLARLRVGAELLAADVALPAERAAALRDQLARDVASLDASVEELLLVSRLDLLDAASRAPVDLLALAAEEAARDGAEVSGEAVSLLGDARSLRHLLRNLLANARRHAPGSEIEVRVEATREGARITVADRGPGVPEPERERIFEPFAKGGSASGGAGLGLAIVRQIARHHGGDARCLPREGGGSVFEVTLQQSARAGETT